MTKEELLLEMLESSSQSLKKTIAEVKKKHEKNEKKINEVLAAL